MNTNAFSLLCRSSAHARLAGMRRAYATASTSKPARPGNPPAHHRPVAAPTAKKFAKPGVSAGSTSPRSTAKAAKAQRAAPVVHQQSPVLDEKTTPPQAAAAAAAAAPTQDQRSAWEDKSIDDQMKELDQLMAMNQIFPTLDPWGQQMETLDVYMPPQKAASWFSDPRGAWDVLRENWTDYAKSFISLYRMGLNQSIPGVEWRGRLQNLKLFGVRSTDATGLLAPFRNEVLSIYKSLNKALAENDKAAIKTLTVPPFQRRALDLLASRDPSLVHNWGFVKELSPVQVISLRATEANLSREAPKVGSRLLVQALVRFDTTQTLQTFTRKGILLDERGQRAVDQRKLPVPRRVTEYYVFEKRMWYDGPWVIREQMYARDQ